MYNKIELNTIPTYQGTVYQSLRSLRRSTGGWMDKL